MVTKLKQCADIVRRNLIVRENLPEATAAKTIDAIEFLILHALKHDNTMFKFDVQESEMTERNGIRVFFVRNPVETVDFSELIKQLVEINNEVYRVKGVERFCHTAPWRVGESIGLWAEKVDDRQAEAGSKN